LLLSIPTSTLRSTTAVATAAAKNTALTVAEMAAATLLAAVVPPVEVWLAVVFPLVGKFSFQ
jgi:predicted Na+-dependent transporter